MTASRLGVVIATRDRPERLLGTLARLEDLPERPPLVVVDNASSEPLAGVVGECHPAVDVVTLDRNLGAAARTVGARRLDTPYVAFSDDDSWWAPGALDLAADIFERHPRVGLVASRTLVGPDERLDPTCAAMAESPLRGEPSLPGPPVLGFVACGTFVRRSAFLAVGGFHPEFGIGGEETLLALDLAATGWQLAYVDEIVSHHHPDCAPRAGRSATQLRNALWSAWLRLPLGLAARETASVTARVPTDASARTALAQAVRGLRWVARERRPVPRRVADAYGMLLRAG